MKIEYMTLSDIAREVITRSQFYDKLLLKLSIPLILSNNQEALKISEDSINYQRAKYIDI